MALIFDFAGTQDFAYNFTVSAGGNSVTGTDFGVTFTLSQEAGAVTAGNEFYMYIQTYGQLLVSNTSFGGSQSFTLTWGTTPGVNTGLNNPSVAGSFEPGEIQFLTTKGSTFDAQNGAVVNTATNPSYTGNVTAIRFVLSGGGDVAQLTSVNAVSLNCFCAGTRIATPAGFTPVEDLRPGDRVLTADDGESTVAWLGEQPVDVRLSHPRKVNPIRIAAGALADGVPARDLYVSQDHAIAIDGLLINAGALVNGSTIYQVRDMPLDGFTYYHVETDAHELLLAEGCAAETFIDYAGRDSFVNGDERDGEPPIQEMDLPRISAARLVPQNIRESLAERAETTTPARRVA